MSYRYLYLPVATFPEEDFFMMPQDTEETDESGDFTDDSSQVKFPPELLIEIFQYMSPYDRKTCLQVSRYFHDIAVRFVFRTIHLDLGEWTNLRSLEWWNTPRGGSWRSWELLYHLLYDRHFATLVRTVVVHSPTDTNCNLDLTGSCLVQGLEALSELRNFQWRPATHLLNVEMVEMLKKFPMLESLSVIHPHSFTIQGMKELKNLQSVSYQEFQRGLRVRDDFSPRQHYRDFLKTNAATLRSLTLPVSFAAHVPPDVLYNLTHLDIWQDFDEKFTRDSSIFLRHVARLSSLTVRVRGLYNVLEAFCNNASHLVGLRSFKLLWTLPFEAWHVVAQDTVDTHFTRLTDFVRGNMMLRRLDLSVGPSTPLHIVMPCIRALSHLEALALRLPAEYAVDDLSFFAGQLPSTLTDLCLFSAMRSPDTEKIMSPLLLKRLVELPLHFLYLSGPLTTAGILPELIHELRYLSHAGCDDVMWDTLGAHQLSFWSLKKVLERTPDHFGHPNPQWLLEYHNIF